MTEKTFKRVYIQPVAEVFQIPQTFNLLVSASVEAEIEDWEIGEDL